MRSIFNFIVEPKEERYNNKKQIGDNELILNTEISDHRYISRNAIVLETPIAEKTDIKKGDEVIVHHNVFRRWYDVRGEEKNSRSFFEDNKYFIGLDQIFLYKRKDKWKAPKGFCFVKPLASDDNLNTNKEKLWTVSAFYSECDEIRENEDKMFSFKTVDEKLKFLDGINDYVMNLEQKYSDA